MVDIITRASKGAPLTNAEMDQNLDSLRNAVDAKAASVHGHNIQDVTNLQSTLDTKAASDHTHPEVTVSVAGLMSSADKNKLNGIAAGATVNSLDSALRDRSTHTGVQSISTISGLADALDAKVDTSIVGFANGVATLDTNGKLPESQLPAVAITNTYVIGNEVSMLDLEAQRGDIAVRSDINKSFVLQTEPASTLANWLELRTPTDAVLSVAGKTGAVSLVQADIAGLPAALAAKQDTLVSGTNIKTVGGVSLLGNGDIPSGGSLPTSTAYTWNPDGTLASSNVDGLVTTYAWHADGRINTAAFPYGGKTRTETYNWDATDPNKLNSVTAVEV